MKQISRTVDGVFMPADLGQEILVTEFQMWEDDVIYDRTVITAACIRIENRPRRIRPVIVFGTASLDPHTEPWKKVVDVVYLDEAIQKLAEQNPNHFMVALFRPLLESDEKVVEKLASQDYDKLKQVISPHAPTVLPLEAIFFDWLVQRFKTHPVHQISKMIAQLTPIEQTVAGKQLINIGVEKGRENGMKKGMKKGKEAAAIKFLNRKFGSLPDELKQKVEALGGAEMDNLLDAIFDQSSLAEFESWLNSRSQG